MFDIGNKIEKNAEIDIQYAYHKTEKNCAHCGGNLMHKHQFLVLINKQSHKQTTISPITPLYFFCDDCGRMAESI